MRTPFLRRAINSGKLIYSAALTSYVFPLTFREVADKLVGCEIKVKYKRFCSSVREAAVFLGHSLSYLA